MYHRHNFIKFPKIKETIT